MTSGLAVRKAAVSCSEAPTTPVSVVMPPLDMRQLTFTRFIAAMTVVFFHWAGVWPALNDWMWKYKLHVGPSMVSYFFVLSGFIMVVVYLRPGRPVDRRRYWAARFARVYPVYFLGVVLMAVPLGFGVDGNRLDPPALVLNVLLQAWTPQYALSLNAPGWSLSVEAFFYLAFPILLPLMTRMRRDRTLLAFTAIVWLTSQSFYLWGYGRLIAHSPFFSHEFLHYNPLVHVNAFVVGMCAGILVLKHRSRLQTPAGARHPHATMAALWLSLFLAVALTMHISRVAGPIPLSATDGLAAPLFAAFVAALSVDSSRLASVLRLAPFVMLGELSYAVYILQIPVAWFLLRAFSGRADVSPAALFAIYLAVLIASSYLAYRYYETPLRWILRDRLSGAARR
ncbi:MAG: acyltransferase family protein [Casimicrobiaceae bacterium]